VKIYACEQRDGSRVLRCQRRSDLHGLGVKLLTKEGELTLNPNPEGDINLGLTRYMRVEMQLAVRGVPRVNPGRVPAKRALRHAG